MFFKKHLALIGAPLACLLGLSSCSWLRDAPKATAQIQGSSLDLSCLRVAPTQLQNLFEGSYGTSEHDQAEVRAIWQCLDKSLNTFAKHTRGAKPGIYTAKELQLFANRYLPDEKPMSTSFTTAIFRLKQAVLGGTDREITEAEITGLRAKLTSFGEMILPLAPHMSVLLTPAATESTGRPAAAMALNKFVMNVADLLGDSVNPLQWVDLSAFVSELEKYTRKDKPTALTYVHEQLGIYQYFKLLLVGGDEFVIENSKWRPIFAAISHFYNALFLSTNTVETLDALSIEVQSTEAEQRRAVEKLNFHLRVLREDKYLASKKMVGSLSDRWGKALVLNAIIFPRSQGSLALGTFLGSTGLRKLAGYLLDQVTAFQADSSDPAKIQALADNLINFIVQAANENSDGGPLTPIAFGPLKEYVQSLRPLFKEEKEFQATLLAIDLFKNTAPILIGKESDSYLPKDLRAVIQKSVDLFLAWRKESKNSVFESIGHTFDVILRAPAIDNVKLEQVENSVQIAQQLTGIMNLEVPLNWDTLLEQVRAGFSLKALLFGNSARSVSAFEFKTLADLWAPFRDGRPIGQSLEVLAATLRDNTFAAASFDKLVPAVERLLPPEQKKLFKVDAESIGVVKSLLVGGSEKMIEGKEYAPLTRLAAKAMSKQDLWTRFQRQDDLPRCLRELADLLDDNTFQPVRFDRLVSAINRFLPAEHPIESYGVNAEILGYAKAALIGGSDTTLEGRDYAPLVRIAAAIMARVDPVQKKLPAKFALGLDSKTLELSAAAIDGVADAVAKIDAVRLKPLISAIARKMGYTLQDSTVKAFVIGFQHRILGRQKTPKPREITGVITADGLRSINTLLRRVQKDWEELERVYTGIDPATGTLRKDRLLATLTSPELKDLVNKMPPILDGKDYLIHFSGTKPSQDYAAYDLLYKAFMRQTVQWLFPAYQIENDPGAGASPRLTYDDVVDLLTDINYLIGDLKLAFGVNPPRIAATKRMQTINLFTKTGNGDDYLDVDETAEFLTITSGGRFLFDRTLERLKTTCKIDPLLTAAEKIPYPCLTQTFAESAFFASTYQDIVPELVRQYRNDQPEGRAIFVEAMFNSTDAQWEGKKEMTYGDFETFIAVPYFAESIFERLDTDHSQVINFTEAMGGFPLFCREIKKAAGPAVKGSCENGYPNQIEAVYGHLLFRGEPPRGPKPGDSIFRKIREIARVLAWFRYWKRLDRDPAYRNARPPQLQRKDLLKIISNLAMATDVPQLQLPPEDGEPGAAPANERPTEQDIDEQEEEMTDELARTTWYDSGAAQPF